MSRGCSRCARYGNSEQQKIAAEYLAAKIDQAPDTERQPAEAQTKLDGLEASANYRKDKFNVADVQLAEANEKIVAQQARILAQLELEVNGRKAVTQLAESLVREEKLRVEALYYMHATSVLFSIQPEGDVLAERKPSKDIKSYNAFIYLSTQGKRLREALALPHDSSALEEAAQVCCDLEAPEHLAETRAGSTWEVASVDCGDAISRMAAELKDKP